MRFLLFVFLPLFVLTLVVGQHFLSAVPDNNAVLRVDAEHEVNVARDVKGVPTISAHRDHDVYFAMGYLHAQDRMWQLEFQRRFAQGRLSEILGKKALRQDVWMRTLGLYEVAKSAWWKLSPSAQQSLTAYTDGVNAWLAENHALPVEFYLLGVTPAPWTEIDSLSWSKVFALNLAGNLDKEVAKFVARQTLTDAQTSSFFSRRDGDNFWTETGISDPALSTSLAKIGELNESIEQTLGIGGRFAGSNAWVVSGKLTASGNAILANDPHLGLQVPSVWYPVVQRGNTLNAMGMSLVGLPVVIFGRNSHIAWGGTNLTADVQDLYLERLDETSGARYLVDEQWQDIQVQVEEIEVASDFPAALNQTIAPVTIEIRRTRNGPIISDVNGNIQQPVSLRWTALGNDDRSYESFFALSYAKNWSEFRTLFRQYVAPAMNMLYADRQGNIGQLVVGDIPIRLRGDGSAPVPGWDSSYDWQGSIPFEELPAIFNPEQGYLVSANDNPVDQTYKHFISDDWAPPERAARIRMLLNEKYQTGKGLSIEDNQKIQADVVSLSAQKLLPLLTAITVTDPKKRRAVELLLAWDGSMNKESVAASIYNTWLRQISALMFGSVVTEDWMRNQQRDFLYNVLAGATPDQVLKALTDPKEVWCSKQKSDRRCEGFLSDALDAAIVELERLAGDDWDDWKWGEIHQTVYKHQPFSFIKGLSAIFDRKIASGGGSDTVNVSSFVFHPSEGYNSTLGAGFRQLIELGPEQSRHLYMNSTGQSANIFSKHYADMVESFENAEYVEFASEKSK